MSDNPIAAGIWPCVVLSAAFGENNGSPDVQVNVRITDGPSAGRQTTYQDQVNGKSGLYVGRSCTAVGWKGVSLNTLKEDVAAWVKATGGATTVEIKHLEVKKGQKYDAWKADGFKGPAPIWDKANSIGRGPKPLKPASGALLSDADEAVRRAMQAEGTAPPEDAPADDDSIPFIHHGEPSPIARSVR